MITKQSVDYKRNIKSRIFQSFENDNSSCVFYKIPLYYDTAIEIPKNVFLLYVLNINKKSRLRMRPSEYGPKLEAKINRFKEGSKNHCNNNLRHSEYLIY